MLNFIEKDFWLWSFYLFLKKKFATCQQIDVSTTRQYVHYHAKAQAICAPLARNRNEDIDGLKMPLGRQNPDQWAQTCHASSQYVPRHTLMTTLHVAAATSFVIRDNIQAKGYFVKANYRASYIYIGLWVRLCVCTIVWLWQWQSCYRTARSVEFVLERRSRGIALQGFIFRAR